jgi:predicted esterase
MALDVGLSYPEPLGGIIGLSGYLFPTTKMSET